MKHGFMLIELIVATLIASMVGGILLTALSQGSRVQNSVDNVVDTSMRVVVAAHQLEKDIMGAFIPVQAEASDKKAEEQPADADVESEQPVLRQAQDERAKEDKSANKAVEKPKPLEKIFFATTKEGNLDTLTFITNNPLVVFVGKDVGVVKPKIARVQYTLKPEADNEHSYSLQRQESIELDLGQWKNVRSYELIGGIKSFAVTYTARIEKKPPQGAEGQAQQKEQQKISYEYKTLKEWVSERKKEGEKEQEFPRIPYNIEIKMELWDKQNKREKEFTLVYEIPIDFMAQKKSEPAKPEIAKPEAAKTPPAAPEGNVEVMQNKSKALKNLTQSLDNLTNMLKQT